MRIFALVVLILMMSTAFSTEIKGVIRKNTIGLPCSFTHEDSFPQDQYSLHALVAYRLEEPLTLDSGEAIKSDTYQMMDTYGDLHLVTYDKSTGYYKFKLTITIKSMVDMNTAFSRNPIVIDRNLIFDMTRTPEVFIEGKVTFVNNQPVLSNINSNKSGFSLEMSPPPASGLLLKALQDIPITAFLK